MTAARIQRVGTPVNPIAALGEVLRRSFNDHGILEVNYKGQRCWLTSDVERVLGYADGALSDMVRREWAAEFREGQHFEVIKGAELAALRKLLRNFATVPDTVANGISAKTRHIQVLYERGLDLVILKSEKPEGLALRKALVEEVIPQVRETGTYVPTAPGSNVVPINIRELELREREAQLAQASYLRAVIEVLAETGELSGTSKTALTISAAELATGKDLTMLRPKVDREGWQTPTQIAVALGIHRNDVGRIISELGLRTNAPGMAESYANKAENSDREVLCWRYSPRAVEMIRERAGASR